MTSGGTDPLPFVSEMAVTSTPRARRVATAKPSKSATPSIQSTLPVGYVHTIHSRMPSTISLRPFPDAISVVPSQGGSVEASAVAPSFTVG